jgi:diguanylate cyclase (GGDEF)-like protein
VNFRHNDYVCRLGGDEFAVVLTNVNKAAMNRIIEKVDEINDTLIHPDDDSPAIKLSCGVAFGDDDKEYEQLFREADEAMYEIKKEGGGCKIAGAGTDA